MPLRHFPPHSSCFARFSKMGGPIFVSPHRTHCTTPLSQASSSSSAYRPAIILLGLGNNLGDHQELVQTLNDKYGVPTVLAKVSRIDWLRNAAGLVDPNYWHGTQIGSDTAKNDFSVNKVQVCGQADVWVEGVVPEVSAHLEGALNISLGGVYHSPVGSDDELRPWCGSPAILEQWVEHLLN